MKYLVAIETIQIVETDAENEEAAIETVKKQMDARVAAAASFSIVQELVYDEKSGSYKML